MPPVKGAEAEFDIVESSNERLQNRQSSGDSRNQNRLRAERSSSCRRDCGSIECWLKGLPVGLRSTQCLPNTLMHAGTGVCVLVCPYLLLAPPTNHHHHHHYDLSAIHQAS